MHLGTIKQVFMISNESAQLPFFLHHTRPTNSCTFLIQQILQLIPYIFIFQQKLRRISF